jgi:uncharacterized protein (DUF1330 family)
MPAYVIVQAEITDWERFKEYLKETPGTLCPYGGKYIARNGEMTILEGNDSGKRIVIIEFPSLQKAREWYHSEEYQQVKKLREGAATGLLIAIEGIS